MYKNTVMKTLANTQQLYHTCGYIDSSFFFSCYEHEMITYIVREKWNTERLTGKRILPYTI